MADRQLTGRIGTPGSGTDPTVLTPRELFPQIITIAQPPNPPTNLILTPGAVNGDLWIDLDWTAGTVSRNAIVGSWTIEVLKSGETLPLTFHPNAADNIPPFRVHALLPDTLYTVTVRANSNQQTTSTPLVGTVTTVHDTTAPVKVTGVSASAAVKTITVTWIPNSDRTVRYTVKLSTSPSMSGATSYTAMGGTASITGLDAAQSYYVTVTAVSAAGINGTASDVYGPVLLDLVQSQNIGFHIAAGNHVRNAAFNGFNGSDTAGEFGMTDTGFDDWYKDSNSLSESITVTEYTTDSFWGPSCIRMNWTTNTGWKGLRQLTPLHTQSLVWPANTTWVVSVWVKFLSGNVSSPHLRSDATGITDSYVTNPTPVVGAGWQRYDIQRVVGVGNVSSHLYIDFSHTNSDLLIGAVQVAEGDAPVSFAPRSDEILARSVSAMQLIPGTITASSGVIGSVAADVITSGNFNGSGNVTIHHVRLDDAYVDGFLQAGRLTSGTIGASLIQLAAGGEIRSTNFSTGSTGWSLSGGGTSEFNSGTIAIGSKFFVNASGSLQAVDNIGIGSDYSGGIYAMSGGAYPYTLQTGYGFQLSHATNVYDVQLVYTADGSGGTEQRAGAYCVGGSLGYTGWLFFGDQFANCQSKTTWSVFSSQEVKRDITSLGLTDYNRLLELRPVSYFYTQGDEHRELPRFGFVAEEVDQSIPELVTPASGTIPMTLSYTDLTPLIIGKIQNLEARLAALEGP